MQGGGGRENGRAGVGIARWDRGEGRERARERGEEKLEHIYVQDDTGGGEDENEEEDEV